jgi:hypothetical protein
LNPLLSQNLGLSLDLRAEISRVGGIAAGHHGQLARGVIDEHVSKRIAALDLADGILSTIIAGSVLLGVHSLQLVVGVADEVVQEEDSWMGVRGLALWVGFKCTALDG